MVVTVTVTVLAPVTVTRRNFYRRRRAGFAIRPPSPSNRIAHRQML